jgi:cytosine/adenosine deaminase-related metal-dependent hydrolase
VRHLAILASVSFLSAGLLVVACSEETHDGPRTTDYGPTTSSQAGGAGGAGGAGVGGTGVGGGGGIMPGEDAVIISQGDPAKILLRGWVITPDQSFAGDVLVEDDIITCVQADCSGETGAATASVVQTNGIIMPGMIDTHNHILFDVFDETDWAATMAYQNHNQWPNEARYGAMIDAKHYLAGESSAPVTPVPLNCELQKYGELKGLVAGTTALLGAAGNRVCHRTTARSIDTSAHGICNSMAGWADAPSSCSDLVRAHTLFPSTSSADSVCNGFGSTVSAYLVHIGEGVDQNSRDELEDLRVRSTVDGCLHDPRTIIVHGTAFTGAEFDIMAAAGMNLTWSPRSNVFLYGLGTDLSKTTDIPLARSKGIRVALAPDWSMGGSANLLQELGFADMLDNMQWGNQLSPQDLVEMVTSNPAEHLALEANIGRLEVGMKADIAVIGGDPLQPYASIVAAAPREVRMTIIDGIVVYGDDQLEPLAPSNPGCEAIDICGRAKFICVARPVSSDKFDQTLADIDTALNQALSDYDALDITQWDFAPITPLARCQ